MRAKVFQDREHPGEWHVEKMDDDMLFTGPNARRRAIYYARHRFGDFDEVELEPYR